jgi:hypothetical protein
MNPTKNLIETKLYILSCISWSLYCQKKI